MRTHRQLSWLFAVALLFAASSVSAADGKATREQMQVKRLQQSQRKLQQENTQLAQEKATLDGQLKAAQSSLDETSSKAQIAANRAAALGKELRGIKTEKEALAAKLAETEIKLAETKETLNKSALAGRQLDTDLKQKNESLNACQAKNAKLHGYGVDLLDRYEKKGCGDALLQADPFTQLKRVEIENLMEDYSEKLDEQKLDEKKMDQASH